MYLTRTRLKSVHLINFFCLWWFWYCVWSESKNHDHKSISRSMKGKMRLEVPKLNNILAFSQTLTWRPLFTHVTLNSFQCQNSVQIVHFLFSYYIYKLLCDLICLQKKINNVFPTSLLVMVVASDLKSIFRMGKRRTDSVTRLSTFFLKVIIA